VILFVETEMCDNYHHMTGWGGKLSTTNELADERKSGTHENLLQMVM